MQRFQLVNTILFTALSLSACDAEDGDPVQNEVLSAEDAEFRGVGDWWDPNGYPGNGNLELFNTSTSLDDGLGDDLIWEIEDDVVRRILSDGTVVLMLLEDVEVRSTEGELLCTCEADENGLMRLREGGADGDVMLTAFGGSVFAGELDFEGKNWWQIIQELYSKQMYWFVGPYVVDAMFDEGPLVMASENIGFADTERKLVLASLVAGECGGDGLPTE